MRRILLLSLLAALCGAPAASASTAGIQGATLTVTGAAGERNAIVVALIADQIRVTDSRATLSAGPGCTASSGGVLCPRAGLAELVADLGDNNDRLRVVRAVDLRGRLRGGTGNDSLAGGGGPDEIDGGTGRDVATYSGRPDGVAVTVGAGADDGAPNEGDDVLSTIEHVVGTRANDVLTGSDGGERLDARGGDDRLDGRAGNDTLIGGTGGDAQAGSDGNDVFLALSRRDGTDVLAGGPGVDRADYGARTAGVVADADGRADDGASPLARIEFTGPVPPIFALASTERDNVLPDVESLRGGRGADVLAAGASGGRIEGRAGTDVVGGGPGVDRLEGGQGFDRLLARDGRADTLSCGTEVDRVFADGSDAPPADCEATSRSFAVALAPVRRVLEGQNLDVQVGCPAQAAVRCVGAVRAATLRRVRTPRGLRPLALGAARFNVPPGGSLVVTISLDAGVRDQLAALRTTRVRLAARGRDEAGTARPAAARFVLRQG